MKEVSCTVEGASAAARSAAVSRSLLRWLWLVAAAGASPCNLRAPDEGETAAGGRSVCGVVHNVLAN